MCVAVTRAVHVSSVLIITQSFHVREVTGNVDPRVESSLLWLGHMVKKNKVCLRPPPVKNASARYGALNAEMPLPDSNSC